MSEPDEEVIELADKLLRMARSGMAQGFVCLIQLEDEVQIMDVGEYGDHIMIAQLELMKVNIIGSLLAAAIPPSRPGPKAIEDA